MVHLLQVCGICHSESTPRWQREAWHLVEEQMLLEARITLLKLASRLDDVYSQVSTAQRRHGLAVIPGGYDAPEQDLLDPALLAACLPGLD